MTKQADTSRTILVLGGGIAGMTAALHIAEAGHRALIVDEAPVIGGALLLLDKTFPTDSCGVCFLAPETPALCPFLECEKNPRVELRPATGLVSLDGEAGNFKAALATAPAYVKAELCTGCGLCEEACPINVHAAHLGGAWLNETRKAIYRPFPQAVPSSFVLDGEACDRCGQCVKACPYGAIDLQAEPETSTVDAAAIVLAPGFGPGDAGRRGAYGYGEYLNVISSLEYERMLSTSSPSQGRPIRPSDGQLAERIAIIQCVGSRDTLHGQPYCSACCCMIAAKQASLTARRAPGSEVALFTMDVRAAGRGYERYLADVKSKPGIAYHRSLVSGVKLNPQTQDLLLEYSEGGTQRAESFDLVVLQVGMVVPQSIQEVAARCGIELDAYGFAQTRTEAPTRTSRAGIFVAGSFREPKDVPGTVVEAAASAAGALEVAGPASVESAAMDEERIVSPTLYDPPMIGVFLDEAVASPELGLDLDLLTEKVSQLPDVVHVGRGIGEQVLRSAIQEKELTFAILGGRTERENGRQRRCLEGVPLAWIGLGSTDGFVHSAWPEERTGKAVDLISMEVQKARKAVPQPVRVSTPEPRAIVVGGGVAGLLAARTLSEQGIETHLLERSGSLGGRLRSSQWDETAWLGELITEVESDPRIVVRLSSEISAYERIPGRMLATVATPDGEVGIAHGALVLATGAAELRAEGYGLGEDAKVVTQSELSSRIADWRRSDQAVSGMPGSVVMIQCAGTRLGERLYCSKNCCTVALENALALKEMKPGMDVAILFRDMVTPGFREDLYRRARQLGILFLRHPQDSRPTWDGKAVTVQDEVLGEAVSLTPDLVILSSGIVPDAEAQPLAGRLGLTLTPDGFFEPRNIKSQPADLPFPGMYVAGEAGGPGTLEESIEQGRAAGLRASLFLRRRMKSPLSVAVVNARLCAGCGQCVEICPTGARRLDEDLGIAVVDEMLCEGCGGCVAACPNDASRQALYEPRAILGAMDVALG